ncbi:hypothetical protein K493DRAFT_316334 [Basidiobolus meristosporus CBS 931.73]|uniref:Uncharacterized protein n=1 Tax=Basidiobolus meristosporus CBS 931.73 TaxID=1314790 RepID=A0A1Y1Y492_9FUNG|nr:hypothetical protein K493DRAFT_316334 [Basidiobolus meristosporus CBS 931.73]|eukprot:ORX92852.1 hypothetical protein K493DRAFT_316334 [Basidiobolus meristosporus CBS 931.73]
MEQNASDYSKTGYSAMTKLTTNLLEFLSAGPIRNHSERYVYEKAAQLIPFNHRIAPVTVIFIEAMMQNRTECIDVAPFMKAHELPLNVVQGQLFPFRTDAGTDGGDMYATRSQKQTIEQMEERWAELMNGWGGYFQEIVDLGIATVFSPKPSRALTLAYAQQVHRLLQLYPGFILARPKLYLDYLRVTLTAPRTHYCPKDAARDIIGCLTIIPELYQPNPKKARIFAWAPPLSLGLDIVEHLATTVREEAALEGDREAKLMEEVAGRVLNDWLKMIVNGTEGQWLLKAEHPKEVVKLRRRDESSKNLKDEDLESYGEIDMDIDLEEEEEGLVRRFERLRDLLNVDGSGSQQFVIALKDIKTPTNNKH